MQAKPYGRSLEIDHIISLELGRSNDIANLYPQRGSGPLSYHVKDKLENQLHDLVCNGTMKLSDVRQEHRHELADPLRKGDAPMTEPTEPKVSYPGVYLEEEGQSGHTIDGVTATPTTAPHRWMQRVAAGGIAAGADAVGLFTDEFHIHYVGETSGGSRSPLTGGLRTAP